MNCFPGNAALFQVFTVTKLYESSAINTQLLNLQSSSQLQSI